MPQVDEQLNELQSTFKGLVYKPSISKARKREQNKREGISYQMKVIARMENSKALLLCKKCSRESTLIKLYSMDVTIGKEDINKFKMQH